MTCMFDFAPESLQRVWRIGSAVCFGSVSPLRAAFRPRTATRPSVVSDNMLHLPALFQAVRTHLIFYSLTLKFSSGLVTLVQKFRRLVLCGSWNHLAAFVLWNLFHLKEPERFSLRSGRNISTLSSDCLLWLWFGVSRTTHPPLLRQTLNSTFHTLSLDFYSSSREALFLSPGSAATDYLHRSTIYNETCHRCGKLPLIVN